MDQKDYYSSLFLKAAEIDENTVDKNLKLKWWLNNRSKSEGGLRLTDEGLEFIRDKAALKIYEVQIPKEVKITPQILVWLDHFINSPWHLVKHTITVISEKTAFELYLFSGDVKKMGQAKAVNKRISEARILNTN